MCRRNCTITAFLTYFQHVSAQMQFLNLLMNVGLGDVIIEIRNAQIYIIFRTCHLKSGDIHRCFDHLSLKR